MAQFVTHIQPTLMEASQGHVPHHHHHQLGMQHNSHLPHSGHNLPALPIASHNSNSTQYEHYHRRTRKPPVERALHSYQPVHQTVSELERIEILLPAHSFAKMHHQRYVALAKFCKIKCLPQFGAII